MLSATTGATTTMCDNCKTDTRLILAAMLSAALAKPLDPFTDHGGDVRDLNTERELLADTIFSLRLPDQTRSPENEVIAEAARDRLHAIPAAQLRDLVLLGEYGESLFAQLKRIYELVLAKRATGGEEAAQHVISRAVADAVLTEAEMRKAMRSGEGIIVMTTAREKQDDAPPPDYRH